MIHHVLTINSQTFVLLDEEHVARMKAAILEAVRGGGGFVECPTGVRSTVEALVTPASIVTVEHIEADGDLPELPATAQDGWLPDTGGIDFI
ncbi:hypothetical protein [Microbacterium sp. HJ5]